MKADPAIQHRIDEFVEACRQRDLKVTHQRMEIFRELISSVEHPDAETVHRGVKRRIPTISLDTVYRNLKFLSEEGLVSIVGQSDERARFEGNVDPHHHFVCEQCGSIQDFMSGDFDDLSLPRGISKLGRAQTLQVSVKGICRACVAKRGR